MRRWIPLVLVFGTATLVYACSDTPVAPRTPRLASTVRSSVSIASTARKIESEYYHACAIDSAGKAWCWGRGLYGMLGRTINGDTNLPIPVIGNRKYAAITAGYQHSCAITLTGAAWCWGQDFYKQLGDGTPGNVSATPLLVPGSHLWNQISAGQNHTCAVSRVNELFCWGGEENGQLGDGVKSEISGPVQVGLTHSWSMVSAGDWHTCALAADSLAYCWGRNMSGMLGTGDTTEFDVPTRVTGSRHYALIEVGDVNTCALTAAGAAYCWGANEAGQIGNGSTSVNPTLTPSLVQGGHVFTALTVENENVCAISASGVAWCWGSNAAGDNGRLSASSVPMTVNTLQRFSAIGGGSFTPCAVGVNRRFYCWGWGIYGQLGDGADTSAHTPQHVKRLVSAP